MSDEEGKPDWWERFLVLWLALVVPFAVMLVGLLDWILF